MVNTSFEQTSKRSVHILITHYGDSFLEYSCFFYENRNLLEEYGIAYPWADSCKGDMFWQGRLYTFFESLSDPEGQTESYTPFIKHSLNQLGQTLQNKRSLLFAGPVGILLGLDRLLYILRDGIHFPDWGTADVHCLWLACDRARELEGAYRYNLPHGYTESLYKNGLANKSIWLGELAKLLRCADKGKLVILSDEQTEHIDAERILKGLGLPIPPERCIPVRNRPFVSRSKLYYEKALGTMFGGDAELFQEALNQHPFAHAPRTFMNPAKLQILHKAYAPAMEALARAHGTPITFTPPQPCADWKPFEPPSPKVFLNILQNTLPALPPEKQEYCLRILDRVWDSPLGPEAQAHTAALRTQLYLPSPDLPLVSVLTLTKNHEKYIGECIESVLTQQTAFPVEHIIVDDGSTDSTPRIIAQYAHKYKSITPIFLSTGGASGRNVLALFSACKSKYAALCDGDDYFSDPQKLQKQVDFMENHPRCTLCFHPVAVIFENGQQPSVFPPTNLLPRGIHDEYYLADLFKGNFIQTNSVVYRWRFHGGLPDWFRPDLCPGDWYWHILHAEHGKIGFLPNIMSVYRRHDNSLYKDSFVNRVVHRKQHGMAELETYWTVNQYFNGRYFRNLATLANGVFADFFEISLYKNDNSKLNEACEKYPFFAKKFLQSLKIIRKIENSN